MERAFAGSNLFVGLRECGAQNAGALVELAHLRFRPLEPRIGGACHRQLLGSSPLFHKRNLGQTQPLRQAVTLGLLEFQRALEQLDRAELTLEKSHNKILADRGFSRINRSVIRPTLNAELGSHCGCPTLLERSCGLPG